MPKNDIETLSLLNDIWDYLKQLPNFEQKRMVLVNKLGKVIMELNDKCSPTSFQSGSQSVLEKK